MGHRPRERYRTNVLMSIQELHGIKGAASLFQSGATPAKAGSLPYSLQFLLSTQQRHQIISTPFDVGLAARSLESVRLAAGLRVDFVDDNVALLVNGEFDRATWLHVQRIPNSFWNGDLAFAQRAI